MTIFSIKKVCFISYLFFPFFLICQENFTTFFQPQIAVNYDAGSFYSHNFSIENRNYLIENGNTNLQVRHLHLAHFSSLQLRENQSIALGIQYRFQEWFDDGTNELRLTQQFNSTKRPMVVRYGHRLRSEQRITQKSTVHRLRYRFSLDLPLQGEKLDVGETYMVANLESLLSVTRSQKPSYDKRLTLNLGWLLQSETKFQFGVEYRTEDFTNELEHVLFFLSSLNFSL